MKEYQFEQLELRIKDLQAYMNEEINSVLYYLYELRANQNYKAFPEEWLQLPNMLSPKISKWFSGLVKRTHTSYLMPIQNHFRGSGRETNKDSKTFVF